MSVPVLLTSTRTSSRTFNYILNRINYTDTLAAYSMHQGYLTEKTQTVDFKL